MYKKIGSRAGQRSLALTVVKQLETINKDATAYSVARALDCSQPTARTLLLECVKLGLLSRQVTPYKNTTKHTFHITEQTIGHITHSLNSQLLNRYWKEKYNG